MEGASPFVLAKDISARLAWFVSGVDVDDLPREQREIVMALKNQAVDLRLEIRDYGMAQTHGEQEQLAKAVAERLEFLQASILKVSEYNLLGAADVAQLSAQVQQLKEVL